MRFFSAPIFEGFFSCSVMLLVLAPLKFSRDSFLMFLCLVPLKYSQGVLLFSCPTQIFSQDAFVFFLTPSNIFKGSQCPSALPPPPPPAAAPLSYNICNICVFKSLNCLVSSNNICNHSSLLQHLQHISVFKSSQHNRQDSP